MKVCQTLWSGHKNLLEDSFGWLSPQHHLMAWTYSCLKLREFYPNVQLYTDSQGIKILINALNLPYTTYHEEYDDLRYNSSMWALPKILTYQKQLEPFIHVDGDVFIFDRFNDNLENADLLAQNLEVSTSYYNDLFSPMKKRIRYTPNFFKKNLSSKYPKSYNAGILGGKDIELLQKYASEALKFIDQNHTCQSNGNFNMIFEQLMFYSISKAYNTEVQCFFDKRYNDNGYGIEGFADFLLIPNMRYLHLIGPLKRNEFVCNQLVRRFFNEYPDYFEKVISLFQQPLHTYFKPHEKSRGQNNGQFKSKSRFNFSRTKSLIDKLYPGVNTNSNKSIELFVKEKNNQVLNEVYKYEKKLYYFLTRKFSRIYRDEICSIEKMVIQSNPFIIEIQNNNLSCILFLNPYIEIIETAFDVNDFNPYEILREEKKQKTIACIPQLFYDGYITAELDAVSINIISILYEEATPITFIKLEEKMSELFVRVDNDEIPIRSLITKRLKFLIGNNMIYLDRE